MKYFPYFNERAPNESATYLLKDSREYSIHREVLTRGESDSKSKVKEVLMKRFHIVKELQLRFI